MFIVWDIYINFYNFGFLKQFFFVYGLNGLILISDFYYDFCKYFWLVGFKVLNMGNINIFGCLIFVLDLKNNIKFGII